MLEERLQQHKDLRIVYLENGLRVVILPNKAPVDRFEAHLEVHAGRVGISAMRVCAPKTRPC